MSRDEYHIWANHTGFKPSMLKEALKRLNVTFEITNPADRTWGFLKDGKTRWSGMMNDMVEYRCHFILERILTFEKVRVGSSSLAITCCHSLTPFFQFKIGVPMHDQDQFLAKAFVVAKPAPYFSWMTLFQPIEVYVWAGIGASFVFVSVGIWLMSKDTSLRRRDRGMRYGDALWYTLGVFLGDNLTLAGLIDNAFKVRYK